MLRSLAFVVVVLLALVSWARGLGASQPSVVGLAASSALPSLLLTIDLRSQRSADAAWCAHVARRWCCSGCSCSATSWRSRSSWRPRDRRAPGPRRRRAAASPGSRSTRRTSSCSDCSSGSSTRRPSACGLRPRERDAVRLPVPAGRSLDERDAKRLASDGVGLPLRLADELDRVQPDGHDAADRAREARRWGSSRRSPR